MKKCLVLWVAVSLCLCCGCSRKSAQRPTKPSVRYVTQVDVTCKKGESALRWYYTDPEKIEPMLLYLKLLQRRGTAEVDPVRVEGDHYEIVLHYSTGERRIYYQHADQYLSQDYKPWERINPEQAKDLQLLLDQMPSDIL